MQPNWTELLKKAVTQPGVISEAYTRFHGYSITWAGVWLETGLRVSTPLGTGRITKIGQTGVLVALPNSLCAWFEFIELGK